MTLHEQFQQLYRDIRTKLKEQHKIAYVIDIKLSTSGIDFNMSDNSYEWVPVSISWSQFDKPDLYIIALNKMLELHKVTEKPLSYLELSDRVELTYPNYTVVLDKAFLLQKQ